MRKSLIYLIPLMCVGLIFSKATVVTANNQNESNCSEDTSNTIEHLFNPRINWSGSVYLVASQWCNVTASNNIFADSPTVTSDISNPGSIFVRVINASGEIVGSTYAVAPGNSIVLDRIPANSGTYTIQARATVTGYHYISVD
ncbi:MAG: hypothetical protein ACI4GD_05765 [Lachnospiraceae bacterium]